MEINNQSEESAVLPKELKRKIDKVKSQLAIYDQEVAIFMKAKRTLKLDMDSLIAEKKDTEKAITDIAAGREKAEKDFEEIQKRNSRVTMEAAQLDEKNIAISSKNAKNRKLAEEKLANAKTIEKEIIKEKKTIEEVRIELNTKKDKLERFIGELNSIIKSYVSN